MSADLVIRNGVVVDGTGAPARRADVAIDGGRIVGVGDGLSGDEVIDAEGRVVAPGFIDIHTHYDAQVFWDPALSSSCWHGVTSVIAGNCGFSIAPTRPEHRRAIVSTLHAVEDMSERMLEAGIVWDFESFDEYLKLVEHAGTVLNFGCYVGHSPVRLFVMGDEGYEREASPEEIEGMRAVVADAMRAGALGFASSFSANHRGDRGLPVPSRNGTTEEFVRIASVLGELDTGVVCYAPGIPVSYLDSYELQPRIGRPLMWTPMLSSYPVKDHRTMLAQHAEGRANGADVYAQVTCLPLKVQIQMTNPYYFRTAPKFLELTSQPVSEFPRYYADPEWRAAAAREVPDCKPPVDWNKFFVAESEANAALIGRSVASIAAERGCTEVDVLCDLALAEDLQTRFLAVLGNDDRGPVTDLMRQEGAVFGQSDAGAHVAQLCDANMPTELLAHWVRDGGELTLEHAIYKLTAELADLFDLHDRGRIAEGAAADIVVFDPETVDPGPLRRVRDLPGDEERLIAEEPTGVEHVLVNGVAITSHGESRATAMTERPGTVLRARSGPRDEDRVMRAAVCYAPHDVRVEDIDDPTPGAGEVKVKIGAVGVCHTDMNYFLGAVPVPMPVVLGHEGAGVVVEIGPGVEAVAVGDHVICSIIGPCEHCFQCLHDNPGLCENAPFFTGKMLDGTTRLSKGGEPIYTLHYQGSYAEYAVVPERFVVSIPPDVPLDVVCGLACGASTGLGAALVRADVQPGSSVVVVGAGGVGLSTMMGAQLAGATTIVAVDVVESKLAKAIELGLATHGINSSTTDAVAAILELTDGRGADYGFDAAGVTGTLDLVIAATRAGATCVVIGRSMEAVEVNLDTRALLRERIITGTYGGSIHPRRHIPEFLELYRQGRLDLGAILDTRYKLDEIAQAFDDLHHGRVTRGVVIMSES